MSRPTSGLPVCVPWAISRRDRPNQLAMDLDATSAVPRLLGIELDIAGTEALHQQTEGWPAGLAACGIAMSNSPNSGAPLIPSGRRREIADCGRGGAAQQSDEVRAFLVRIAFAQTVQRPTLRCNARPGRVAELLDRLDRIHLFVVPLDDERGRYRFHHLFGELLNDQFERMGAPERNLLLDRASALAPRTRHDRRGAALRAAQRRFRTCGPDRPRTWSEADQSRADRHASSLDRALDRRRGSPPTRRSASPRAGSLPCWVTRKLTDSSTPPSSSRSSRPSPDGASSMRSSFTTFGR